MSEAQATDFKTTSQMYRALMVSVYLPSLLIAICISAITLSLPLFALELGADVGVTSIVFALTGLGSMTVIVPAGYFTARLGDRTMMIIGLSVVTLTALLTSLATSPIHLSIAAFVLGAAMGLWGLARLTFVSAAVPLHMRGKALSSMAGLARFGSLLGPVAAGFIALRFGYSGVFAAVGVLALVILVLTLTSIKVNHTSGTKESPSLLALVPHIVRGHWKVFATAGTSLFFLSILRACRGLFIPLWGAHIGLDAASIGLVVGAAAAIDTLMFPLAGYILDHWGRRYAAVACQLTMALGLLLVPFSTTFAGLTLFAMVTGMGNGLGSGINMTFGADFAKDGERSEFLAVWRLVLDTGLFVGPLFAGAVASSIALGGAFVATSSLGVIGAVIMVVFVKETLVKRPH